MTDRFEKLYNELSSHEGIVCKWNEPLSKHTSFKIGGETKLFCELYGVKSISYAIMKAKEFGLSPYVLGNGTNVLFPDSGVGYPVFKICGNKIDTQNDVIACDSGASLMQVSLEAKKKELTGLEFAYGIPGTVGGAVVMNAGAYGSEIKDILVESTYLDKYGNIKTLNAEQHNFGYRQSFYKENPENIVLSATFKLNYGNADEISAKMADILVRRKEKQPLEYPSAGSVFKRPEGYFAGALIEQSGLKGYTIGGAQVSEKHAGFIINRGGATCDDVKNLVFYIKEKVHKDHGVGLECEIIFAPEKL